MSASVPDPRECIHLRVDSQNAPSLSMGVGSHPGSLKKIVLGHCETMFFHECSVYVVGISVMML
jgi:hypothetical protein